MRKIFAIFFLIVFLCSVGSIYGDVTPTPTPTSEVSAQLQDRIRELESKISELHGQSKTLSSQIAVMDNQARLTQLRIDKTNKDLKELEKDIGILKGKISNLEVDLDKISGLLIKKVVATYQAGVIKNWELFLTANGFSDFLYRVQYLKIAQENDKRLILATQATKDNFENQKKVLEDKQKQVEALNKQLGILAVQLAQQKKDKAILLDATRNDERRYQDLLAKARAEQAAILGILAGGGTVAQIGPIKTGETISSTIAGPSACSSGNHLHFEVVKDNSHQNPANYLKNTSLKFESGVQPFTPSGSWDWPLDEPIDINQEYGMTYWAKLGWYGGGPHTGIDMFPGNLSTSTAARVKAARDGTLFRGSIACGGGTLKFARVDQADGIQTYYLHIN